MLKDASDTAIYGARGANGVIIITAKGGKQGRTTINYNGAFGFREVMKKLDVMRPYDFIQYQYERTRGSSQDSTNFAKSYGPWDTLGVYRNLPGRDWQEEVFGRKAIMQTHNLNISGDTKQTKSNISITSNREQGVMLGSDFDRKVLSVRILSILNNPLPAIYLHHYVCYLCHPTLFYAERVVGYSFTYSLSVQSTYLLKINTTL